MNAQHPKQDKNTHSTLSTVLGIQEIFVRCPEVMASPYDTWLCGEQMPGAGRWQDQKWQSVLELNNSGKYCSYILLLQSSPSPPLLVGVWGIKDGLMIRWKFDRGSSAVHWNMSKKLDTLGTQGNNTLKNTLFYKIYVYDHTYMPNLCQNWVIVFKWDLWPLEV